MSAAGITVPLNSLEDLPNTLRLGAATGMIRVSFGAEEAIRLATMLDQAKRDAAVRAEAKILQLAAQEALDAALAAQVMIKAAVKNLERLKFRVWGNGVLIGVLSTVLMLAQWRILW